jgi:hypothetical protein
MLKPALLALLLALAPGAPESVTLRAEPRTVTFGDRVRLSGVVAPDGDRVTVVALPYDGGAFPTDAAPGPDGRWGLFVQPLITTQYRAQAGAAESAEAPVVSVRPRVHLVVISARRGLFHTRAEALRSYRGRFAWFQRLTPQGWRPVKRLRLGSRSAARFRASVPRGPSRVRVVVEPVPGYERGVSRVARIRR